MKKLLFLLVAVIFVACSGKSENELKGELNNLLKDKKYKEAEKTFETFISEYPESKSSDSLIFEFAKLYHSRVMTNLSSDQNLKNAVKFYEKLYTEYPKSSNAPHAMFMCAFIYANELKDLNKAKDLYNKFLRQYPNHELAASAKIELDNLGIPPADILKKFDGSK